VTTEQAAAMVRRDPSRIRHWVRDGFLAPLNPGRRPLRFREADVWRCERDRLSDAERAELLAKAAILRAG